MQKFIIFSYGHSATGTLTNVLKQHEDIGSYGELLNKDFNYNSYPFPNECRSSNRAKVMLDYFFNTNTEKKCLGFNFHFAHSQFYEDSIYDNLLDTKLIILKRNPLFVFLRGKESIDFDINEFNYFIEKYNNNYRNAESTGNPTMKISMEEMIKDINGHANKLFNFLGMSPKQITTNYSRQHSNDLSQRISNYNDIKPLIEQYL